MVFFGMVWSFHKSSAADTQLVFTQYHKVVVFWYSDILIQVISMASCCLLVTVAGTVHHYYLLQKYPISKLTG